MFINSRLKAHRTGPRTGAYKYLAPNNLSLMWLKTIFQSFSADGKISLFQFKLWRKLSSQNHKMLIGLSVIKCSGCGCVFWMMWGLISTQTVVKVFSNWRVLYETSTSKLLLVKKNPGLYIYLSFNQHWFKICLYSLSCRLLLIVGIAW